MLSSTCSCFQAVFQGLEAVSRPSAWELPDDRLSCVPRAPSSPWPSPCSEGASRQQDI